MADYSLRTSRSRWRRNITILLGAMVILLVGAVVAIRQTYMQNLKPVSASQKAQLITIPTGSSARQIGVSLEKSGIIRKSWAFEWYIRNHDLRDKLQAGTYSLRQNESVADIATALTQGKIATNLVTILPAQRLDQIRRGLINVGFSAEDVDAALNPAAYKDHPALVDKPPGATLEGYLYPDSYQKTATSKPQSIIRASLDQMQKHLTPEIREGITKQGLTIHQGVILASIVEQEVSNGSDRPIVAQVFLKRLRDGMVLGSDVTAIYGSLIANKTPSLAFDSPYNTHLYKGLTPSPISNVSVSALQAVATPANGDYLFFVAGDDGVTYFSKTIEEHESLTRLHCKKLCNL